MTHFKHTLLSGVSTLDTTSIDKGGFHLPPALRDGKFHLVRIERREGVTTTFIDGKVYREPWFPHRPVYIPGQERMSQARTNVKRLLKHLDEVIAPNLQDYLFARPAFW